MKSITSESAPAAIGPYSQAIKTGNLIFCSGQLPLNPEKMEIVEGIHNQTEQIITNMEAVLSASNLGLENIVKCTVFLQDLKDFTEFNEIYAKRFGSHKPARSTFQVAALPMGALIEIECIAEVAS